ncbi:MAG: cell division topological specificity factor MinE [SAR324 cluster bacterium]|jgi:cell division topological specificity factor MinE|nr:cell division topological specificity factor MinE [SAR324 cluster bacterium]HBI30330.1 cell division topological specificity factor MinE [Deltaproteobacteria bacterium]HIF70396.1 cell division topological specificity factor MinE [Candidatus Lambdaproteobacteria bacterium]HIL15148.1 cell division topological specificity factor MinE [Deltaproteobacteria bacterium]HIL87716.1 cell division topological specificity factor MinE [Deltaproteobacteria bacterium]|tara:strand:- start:362 stop:616 length:255 start_codon:yes stop_codon:yes gene_type:complete
MFSIRRLLLGQRDSASVAKNRLQLVLSKDRIQISDAELKSMKEELYRVISHYFTVTPDNLEIEVLTRDGRAALSVNTPVEFPAR